MYEIRLDMCHYIIILIYLSMQPKRENLILCRSTPFIELICQSRRGNPPLDIKVRHLKNIARCTYLNVQQRFKRPMPRKFIDFFYFLLLPRKLMHYHLTSMAQAARHWKISLVHSQQLKTTNSHSWPSSNFKTQRPIEI